MHYEAQLKIIGHKISRLLTYNMIPLGVFEDCQNPNLKFF